eukprot:675910-Prorocentrum_minimum.AAC.1
MERATVALPRPPIPDAGLRSPNSDECRTESRKHRELQRKYRVNAYERSTISLNYKLKPTSCPQTPSSVLLKLSPAGKRPVDQCTFSNGFAPDNQSKRPCVCSEDKIVCENFGRETASLQEVLPKAGLVYSEKGNLSEVLCKPKIMPLKSITLERLEEMEKAAADLFQKQQEEQAAFGEQ